METLAILEKKANTVHRPALSKVNSDGAIHTDKGRAASGAILRSTENFIDAGFIKDYQIR